MVQQAGFEPASAQGRTILQIAEANRIPLCCINLLASVRFELTYPFGRPVLSRVRLRFATRPKSYCEGRDFHPFSIAHTRHGAIYSLRYAFTLPTNWWPGRELNPQNPAFETGAYANSATRPLAPGTGVGPILTLSESAVLPLHYPGIKLVEMSGFAPEFTGCRPVVLPVITTPPKSGGALLDLNQPPPSPEGDGVLPRKLSPQNLVHPERFELSLCPLKRRLPLPLGDGCAKP